MYCSNFNSDDVAQFTLRAPQVVILLFVALGTIPIVGGVVMLLAGPGLLLAGLAVMLAGASGLGDSLTPWPAPVDDNELSTTGIYGIMRHPQYSGEYILTISRHCWFCGGCVGKRGAISVAEAIQVMPIGHARLQAAGGLYIESYPVR